MSRMLPPPPGYTYQGSNGELLTQVLRSASLIGGHRQQKPASATAGHSGAVVVAKSTDEADYPQSRGLAKRSEVA